MAKSTMAVIALVAGIILLVMGFNEYGTFGSKLGRALGGGMSNRVILLFLSGGVCTAYGLLNIGKGGKR